MDRSYIVGGLAASLVAGLLLGACAPDDTPLGEISMLSLFGDREYFCTEIRESGDPPQRQRAAIYRMIRVTNPRGFQLPVAS